MLPKALFITDAAINIYPTIQEKTDIAQNAIDLGHIPGLQHPKGCHPVGSRDGVAKNPVNRQELEYFGKRMRS